MGGLDDNDDGRMSNDDAERVLYEAFRARAHGAIGDYLAVPPMSEPMGPDEATPATPARTRHLLWAAPLAVAVVVAAVVLATTLVSRSSPTSGHGSIAGAGTRTTSGQTPGATASGSGSTSATTPSGPPPTTVRVTSDLNDGSVVGVGEPIVLNFSPTPTNSTAFTKAVTVTVNGQPATGAWYWEKPYASQPVQAHYREQGYWPANATIQVKLPIGGLSAGTGLAFSGALNSVTFRTGDAHVSTVDASTLTMTVTDNGRTVRTIPVSLGAAKTPTFNGTKVVMQKGEDLPGTNTLRSQGTVMMSGPGYSNDPVPWSVRVTASGEYVHAAAWNTHIGTRSTSNGCTNLKPADGAWFYAFSQLGDVVRYVNTNGARLNPLDGLGDWNVPWPVWLRGGLLVNH
jgi:lipoprotein-anchoring transpeptidase ErfK/SrfK